MERKILTAIAAASVLLTGATMSVRQQVVGYARGRGGRTVRCHTGWSANRQVLGKMIYNDSGDGIG